MTVIRIEKELWKEADMTREWCPEQWNTRAQRVDVQGHCCGSGWKYMREWERDIRGRACLFANQCEFLYLPVLYCIVLLVNFAPVGYLCGREKSADFVYHAGWWLSALCCCALVILRVCLREPDKIWASLGQSMQKLTLPLTDGSGEISDVTRNPYSVSLKNNLTEPQTREKRKIHQTASSNLQFYSLCLGSFGTLWHVLACLRDTCQRMKKHRRKREK